VLKPKPRATPLTLILLLTSLLIIVVPLTKQISASSESPDYWESVLLVKFDALDALTVVEDFVEIVDDVGKPPSFTGELTKYCVKVVVTDGKNLDDDDGIEFRHSNDGSTDAVTIGSITGPQLNVEGTYWVNSTDPTLLAQVEHDGVAQEWLHYIEVGFIGPGEALKADIYVIFEYTPVAPAAGTLYVRCEEPDAPGAKIENANVTLWISDTMQAQALTNATGWATFTDLAFDTYNITVYCGYNVAGEQINFVFDADCEQTAVVLDLYYLSVNTQLTEEFYY